MNVSLKTVKQFVFILHVQGDRKSTE